MFQYDDQRDTATEMDKKIRGDGIGSITVMEEYIDHHQPGTYVKTYASIHPFIREFLEFRLGYIPPSFKLIRFHPNLYRAVHQDLLSVFTDWFGDSACATQVHSAGKPYP